jgi:hypothetical protein
VHIDAALCEWQRDTPCPNTEFECSAITGQFGQHVDCWAYDGLVEHIGRRFIVGRRDRLTEVVVILAHQR